MQSWVQLVALAMIATTAVVAPTGYGRLDLHRGESLHPIFDHSHPDNPVAPEDLAPATAGQHEMHGADTPVLASPIVDGQLLPRLTILPVPGRTIFRLSQQTYRPAGIINLAIDPPPRAAQ